jgi:nanoRNase/pAp phosphatase (c-di-AMP/oligoRNAs hydrolase)
MSETLQKHRLVTRSDFDGLACAVILKEMDAINDILFVHPKDMQDRKVEITDRDITTNLPYVPGVHLAFDHHLSETLRNEKHNNHIIDPDAPSAARVVYDFYGGPEKLPAVPLDMMAAVDQGDSAQFDLNDILEPQGWTLLNHLMDARTGLGRFRDFRVSNYQLMMQLIDNCRDYSIEKILELPDVKERVELYHENQPKAREQIMNAAKVYDNLVVLDLREEDPIWATNRFLVYALFPKCNISIHQMWGVRKQNTVFAIGKSILKRDSKTNIGELCLGYGGGGHLNAGTCQIDNDDADRVLGELVTKIRADG